MLIGSTLVFIQTLRTFHYLQRQSDHVLADMGFNREALWTQLQARRASMNASGQATPSADTSPATGDVRQPAAVRCGGYPADRLNVRSTASTQPA